MLLFSAVWLTRNSENDLSQKCDNRKLCDVIATSSIIYNCAGMSTSAATRQKCVGVAELKDFLEDYQEEKPAAQDDIMMLIQVRSVIVLAVYV